MLRPVMVMSLLAVSAVGAQAEIQNDSESRRMSIGVAGGIFRDAFDAAADDERSGGILALRLAYGSRVGDGVAMSYVAALDHAVSHDVGRHDGTSYIVSGYS